MNHIALSKNTLSETIIEGNEIEVLDNIWARGCDVAVYHRKPDYGLQDWLDNIPPENLPVARLSLEAEQVKNAISNIFKECEIYDNPHGQWLIADISSLAKYFQRLMRTKKVNLRLDVVDNNACRKFHQDYVAARLLSSYRGRGTQYGICQTNEEPNQIHELPQQSIGIFKGRRWLPAMPSSLYHRSPPIEGTGETRLLLVIDTGTCDDDCGTC